MNALTSVGLCRARGRKTAKPISRSRSLCAARNSPCAACGSPPLGGRQQIGSLPGVGLGLAHALAQHLRADTEITRDLRDRTAGLQRKTDTAVKQLLRVLPGSWHNVEFLTRGTNPSFQGLRENRPGSDAADASSIAQGAT